jgi:hypothetical protein
MAANWFKPQGTGDITIEVTTYKGGTISKPIGTTDFRFTGEIQIQQQTFLKKISIQGTKLSHNIESVTNVGTITYIKNSSEGQIVIT